MSKISSPSDDVTSPLPPEEGIAVVERVVSVQVVIDRADKFFDVMPIIPDTPEGDSDDDDVAVNDAV